MAKFKIANNVLVGRANVSRSDHRVLVDNTDTMPDFLFDKQSPTTQVGFVLDNKSSDGKFLALLDKNHPERI